MPTSKIALPALTLLSMLTVVSSSLCAPPPVGEHDLAAMSPREKWEFLVSTQQWRELELSNFSYTGQMAEYRVAVPSGKKTALLNASFSVSRDGPSYILHLKSGDVGTMRGYEFRANWSGGSQKYIQLTPHKAGGFRSIENPMMRRLAYNHLLGFRVCTEDGVLSQLLTRLYSQCNDQGNAPPSVAFDHDSLLRANIAVARGRNKYTFWFDPENGYAPVRYRVEKFGATPDNLLAWEEHTVLDWLNVDGLRIPKVVTQRTGNVAVSDAEGLWTYEISEFRRNVVVAADLTINFPAGLPVVDEVTRRAYDIGPKGEEIPKPLYDSAAGKFTGPGAVDLNKSIAHPIVRGRISRNTWRLWVGGSLIVLSLVGAFVVPPLLKRRARVEAA